MHNKLQLLNLNFIINLPPKSWVPFWPNGHADHWTNDGLMKKGSTLAIAFILLVHTHLQFKYDEKSCTKFEVFFCNWDK